MKTNKKKTPTEYEQTTWSLKKFTQTSSFFLTVTSFFLPSLFILFQNLGLVRPRTSGCLHSIEGRSKTYNSL